MNNKKVLLRERKRHTARRVASARMGGTPSSHGGGYLGYPPPPPSRPGRGVPHPVMMGQGTQGTPIQTCLEGTPSSHGGQYLGYPPPPSRPDWGVPPSIQTWLGAPHPVIVGGTPHHNPDLAGGHPIQS